MRWCDEHAPDSHANGIHIELQYRNRRQMTTMSLVTDRRVKWSRPFTGQSYSERRKKKEKKIFFLRNKIENKNWLRSEQNYGEKSSSES